MSPHAQSRTASHNDDGDQGDSLDLILDYARQSYQEQLARVESYRARAGALLAFAAVLVTFSTATASTNGRAPTQAAGTLCVVLAAVLFLLASSARGSRLIPSVRWLTTAEVGDAAAATKARLLRSLLVALESNQRPLRRLGILLYAGLLWLLLGTVVLGARLTLLLL